MAANEYPGVNEKPGKLPCPYGKTGCPVRHASTQAACFSCFL